MNVKRSACSKAGYLACQHENSQIVYLDATAIVERPLKCCTLISFIDFSTYGMHLQNRNLIQKHSCTLLNS